MRFKRAHFRKLAWLENAGTSILLSENKTILHVTVVPKCSHCVKVWKGQRSQTAAVVHTTSVTGLESQLYILLFMSYRFLFMLHILHSAHAIQTLVCSCCTSYSCHIYSHSCCTYSCPCSTYSSYSCHNQSCSYSTCICSCWGPSQIPQPVHRMQPLCHTTIALWFWTKSSIVWWVRYTLQGMGHLIPPSNASYSLQPIPIYMQDLVSGQHFQKEKSRDCAGVPLRGK